MSDINRLKAQQEAQAAQIQKLNMQIQANNARREPEHEEQYIPPSQKQQQPQYEQVNHKAMLDQIVQSVSQKASENVTQQMMNQDTYKAQVEARYKRLSERYPAVREDDSKLTIKARDVYARVRQENPNLDEVTAYELAVTEAANYVGARPLDADVIEMASQDYTMPSGHNPAMGRSGRSGKSRLTQEILSNAKIMGINIDPGTAEGKKNLSELEEYTARFNADVDESHLRFR